MFVVVAVIVLDWGSGVGATGVVAGGMVVPAGAGWVHPAQNTSAAARRTKIHNFHGKDMTPFLCVTGKIGCGDPVKF